MRITDHALIELKIFGVRGSAPISGKDYVQFGGNTASLTLRTPENTLIFLDAGSGIRMAQNELHKKAKKVFLLISHTHADHIMGFGMTGLPYLNTISGYESQKLNIIGPSDVEMGLSRFYDGEYIWPVSFQPDGVGPKMTGISHDSIIKFEQDNQEINIDKSTKVTLMKGNHPSRDGVLLSKFEITAPDGKVITIIYATDNEFDFLSINEPNPEANNYKNRYLKFIENANLLIADAQYTEDDYHDGFQGFGHSYHQQVIGLANEANIEYLMMTHHHLYKDTELLELERELSYYIRDNNWNIQFRLAREGDSAIY